MRDMTDDLLEQIDLTKRESGVVEKTNLSLHVFVEDKAKFDKLQEHTRKRFGEDLRQILIPLIRRAHAKISSDAS
jgi:hypothetical protein